MSSRLPARILIALVLALPMLAASSASYADHAPPAASTAETPTTTFSDWLGWVRDDTPLSEITWPGTHDTVSIFGSVVSWTQSLCGTGSGDLDSLGNKLGPSCDVRNQLDAGIRAFDLRGACHYDEDTQEYSIRLFHGTQYQHMTLETLLTDTRHWLDLHPTETVLMKVTHAAASGKKSTAAPTNCLNADGGRGTYFKDRMKVLYDDPFYDFWRADSDGSPATGTTTSNDHLFANIPTLDRVRDKMVLEVNYANADLPTLDFAQRANGSPVQSGDHYSVCLACAAPSYPNTDYGGTITLANRRKEITTHLKDAGTLSQQGILRETAIAGTGSVPIFEPSPVILATGHGLSGSGLNQTALDTLWSNTSLTSAGIVLADFPGPALVGTLILKNLSHAKPVDPNASYYPTMLRDFQVAVREVAREMDLRAKSGDSYSLSQGRDRVAAFFNALVPEPAAGGAEEAFEVTVIKDIDGDRANAVPSYALLAANARGAHRRWVLDLVELLPPPLEPQALQNAYLDARSTLSGTAGARASTLRAFLKNRFPGIEFAVVAAKAGSTSATSQYSKDFVHTQRTVWWSGNDGKNGGWGYLITAWSHTVDPGLQLVVPDPYPNPGQTIALRATTDTPVPGGSVVLHPATGGPAAAPSCTATPDASGTQFSCSVVWPDLRSVAPVPYVASLTAGGTTVDSSPGNVTQDYYVTDPIDDRTITVGDSAAFTIAVQNAAGRSSQVAWYVQSSPLGTRALGIKGPTLTLNYPDSRDSAVVTPEIVDLDQHRQSEANAHLTVLDPGPRFLEQPSGPTDACADGGTLTSRIAGGRPLTIAWQRYADGEWSAVPNGTTIGDDGRSTLSLPPGTPTEYRYRVVATDPAGTATSTEFLYFCT